MNLLIKNNNTLPKLSSTSDSSCLNCSLSFSTGHKIEKITKIPISPHDSLAIDELLISVFKLIKDEADIVRSNSSFLALCSKCSSLLAQIYALEKELLKLNSLDSFLNLILKKREESEIVNLSLNSRNGESLHKEVDKVSEVINLIPLQLIPNGSTPLVAPIKNKRVKQALLSPDSSSDTILIFESSSTSNNSINNIDKRKILVPTTEFMEMSKKYNCSVCSAKFLHLNSLEFHTEWIHSGKTRHLCNNCFSSFSDDFSLKEHLKLCQPPQNLTPSNNNNNKAKKRKSSTPQRRESSESSKNYLNHFISRSSSNNADFPLVISEAFQTEPKNNSFSCNYCSKIFTSISARNLHLSSCANLNANLNGVEKIAENNRERIGKGARGGRGRGAKKK